MIKKKNLVDVLLGKSLLIIEKNAQRDAIKRRSVHLALNRELRFDKELSKMILKELQREGFIINTKRNIIIKKRRKR
jgi:hypothetical protein